MREYSKGGKKEQRNLLIYLCDILSRLNRKSTDWMEFPFLSPHVKSSPKKYFFCSPAPSLS